MRPASRNRGISMDYYYERWKDIPGYENFYQVSDKGRIRGLDRVDSIGRNIKGKIISSSTDSYGYSVLHLYKDGKYKHFKVHRLVMIAFVGHSILQVNHKDGNKRNNMLSNLEYCNNRENQLHAIKLGLCPTSRGEQSNLSKLKDSDIPVIRRRLEAGESCKAIGESYGVLRQAIYLIKVGKTWKHI